MPKALHIKNLNDFEKGPTRRSLFSNGLTIIHHHAKGFSGSRINVNFMAGSMFEKPEQYGLAHLLEHLVFKEVESHKLAYIESMGAGINAYTFKENICFEMSVLAKKLPLVIDEFIELVCTLEFSEDQFKKEKQVVLQELREDLDDHESMGLEYLFEKNFPEDLGHPVAGTIKSVSSLNSHDIRKYHKKYFSSARMIITIVSGEDNQNIEQKIYEKVSSLVGDKPQKPFRLKASRNSKPLIHFKKTLSKNVESSILFLAFNGPSINSGNYYEYVLLDDLLFEGLSSEFFKKFREENAYVYGLGSSLNPFSNTGSYIMVFNTQKKYLDEIYKGVFEVLERVATFGVDETRLQQSKDKYQDGWHLGLDGLDDRVELLQDNEIYQLDDYNFASMQKKLDQVTVKTVQKLCKKLYTEPYTHMKLQPKGQSDQRKR